MNILKINKCLQLIKQKLYSVIGVGLVLMATCASADSITPAQGFMAGGILSGAGNVLQNFINPQKNIPSTSPATAPTVNNGISLTPSNSLNTLPTNNQQTTTATSANNTSFTPNSAQSNFYTSNQNANNFGANLFTGAFARLGPTQFNADYMIAIGDSIEVRLWGSLQMDSFLTVDPKGNIYIPNIGPVYVLGIKNHDLQHVVETAISKVYKNSVLSYSTLTAAQPVRVFVGGYVNLPGMYSGTSMDSLLSYLDQAGGIDAARGSFLKIEVKRGDLVRASFNLYDFLLQGKMPLIQLADGDVILATTRKNTFTTANGLVENSNQFEFNGESIKLSDVIKLSKPFAQVNHVLITRNDSGVFANTEYFPINSSSNVNVNNGDVVQFTSDKKVGTISIRVQGEHESEIAYVLPHGARLGDVMKNIKFSERSDPANIQLFRLSAQALQTQQLQSIIQTLQANVLTSRSGTALEEGLRSQEATRMLQWVASAKQIQPLGQVLIAQTNKRDDLLLENGDIINIPAKSGLVNVSGLVLFPTSIAYDKTQSIDDYITKCGGYTQKQDQSRVIISHLDGSFSDINEKSNLFSGYSKKYEIREGDTIMVLPYVDPKLRQYWLEMSQIIAQVAITAKVVLGL